MENIMELIMRNSGIKTTTEGMVLGHDSRGFDFISTHGDHYHIFNNSDYTLIATNKKIERSENL